MSSPSSPFQPGARALPPDPVSAIYTFYWSELILRLPLVSAFAVAICLFAGIFAGHPGAGLIGGGGALTIGFGVNHRISESRLLPMLAALFAVATSTLAGTLAGHSGYALLLCAAGSAFIYGQISDEGYSWVSQQASIALLVASAFPTTPSRAFTRAGLILAGGLVQIAITSIALRLLPELRTDMLAHEGQQIWQYVRGFPQQLPSIHEDQQFGYTVRVVLTTVAATWAYMHIGVQSGYWIPMTALLVQKPTLRETAARSVARIVGTLIGAWLCSLLIAHLAPSPWVLAAFTTLFAFCTFATSAVNYGLFTVFITAYIVCLLSLNQIPGTTIAHRRAWCTIVGGAIALVFHIDALRRYRAPTFT